MCFEEYKRQVVRAAQAVIRNIPEFRGWICTDTIRDSWEEGMSIKLAAERAIDDTLDWD